MDTPIPVQIKWLDALTVGDSRWQCKEDIDNILEDQPPLMHTIGFLLYKCDVHVCVTDSIGENEYGHMTKIPIGMIQELTYLAPQTKEETYISQHGL